MELTSQLLMIMYKKVLANFQNEVNRKFSPEFVSNYARRINGVNHKGKGKGGKSIGSGRGGIFGRFKGNQSSCKPMQNKSKILCLTSGITIEIHFSFNFGPNIWSKIPKKNRYGIWDARAAYKHSRNIQK